jgi:hypothetical protein
MFKVGDRVKYLPPIDGFCTTADRWIMSSRVVDCVLTELHPDWAKIECTLGCPLDAIVTFYSPFDRLSGVNADWPRSLPFISRSIK